MEKHVIHNPDGPDMEFEGSVIIRERSADLGMLRIYKTRAGSYVAEQRRNALRGREMINRAAAFRTLGELAAWMGNSRDAKAIMERIGHPVRRQIE